jgi:hypothetical protein
MSTSNQTTSLSTSNFTPIFDAALEEYERPTKRELSTPLTAKFEACNSLDTVLDVFRGQTQAFDTVCKGGGKLMIYLNPIVQVLFTLSARLEECSGLVSKLFAFPTFVSTLVS